MRLGIILACVVLLLAVAGGAFFGGMKYGENRAAREPAAFFERGMGGQGLRFEGQAGEFAGPMGTPGPQARAFGPGGEVSFYTIVAIEGDSLTVSTPEGSLKVHTTDTTLIQKTMSVAVQDLEVGEQVLVSGPKNDDGSITARSIRSMSGMGMPASAIEEP